MKSSLSPVWDLNSWSRDQKSHASLTEPAACPESRPSNTCILWGLACGPSGHWWETHCKSAHDDLVSCENQRLDTPHPARVPQVRIPQRASPVHSLPAFPLRKVSLLFIRIIGFVLLRSQGGISYFGILGLTEQVWLPPIYPSLFLLSICRPGRTPFARTTSIFLVISWFHDQKYVGHSYNDFAQK